ncbi:hypothetical protein [Paenibacillus hamazuiensis]|uniref:hypothetical protein n=1 Tax=Paenibacillus hamazuiensis TaxID=2936508 RepID=UPI00200E4FAB|nr:hypothetical protein [Paenibacillus hamazuiensis]
MIITGRNADKLQKAKAAYPGLVTYTCDVSKEEERAALIEINRQKSRRAAGPGAPPERQKAARCV